MTARILILTVLLFSACTIVPTAPKPRQQPLKSGNVVIKLTPTHDSTGKFTGYWINDYADGNPGTTYIEILNSLYDGWGYLLTPPRKAGYGITPLPFSAWNISAEAERNRIILEAYRDMGKPKQGIISKIADHL